MHRTTLGKPGKSRLLPSQFALGPARPDPNGNRRERRAAKAQQEQQDKRNGGRHWRSSGEGYKT